MPATIGCPQAEPAATGCPQAEQGSSARSHARPAAALTVSPDGDPDAWGSERDAAQRDATVGAQACGRRRTAQATSEPAAAPVAGAPSRTVLLLRRSSARCAEAASGDTSLSVEQPGSTATSRSHSELRARPRISREAGSAPAGSGSTSGGDDCSAGGEASASSGCHASVSPTRRRLAGSVPYSFLNGLSRGIRASTSSGAWIEPPSNLVRPPSELAEGFGGDGRAREASTERGEASTENGGAVEASTENGGARDAAAAGRDTPRAEVLPGSSARAAAAATGRAARAGRRGGQSYTAQKKTSGDEAKKKMSGGGSSVGGRVGLTNLGNTCFMNAALQV